MITATYKIRTVWNREVIESRSADFETLNDLEHFLSYNRSFITELSFTGKLKEDN